MRSAPTCPDCGAPLARRSHRTTGRHRAVEVEVDWPVLACPDGHRYHVHPDFGALFIVPFHERLQDAYRGSVPQGRRTPLRRRPRCPACGGIVSRDPVGSIPLAVLVDVPGTEPVEVRGRLPTFACTRCGQAVGWWSPILQSDLADAVTASIEAAGIRHRPRLRRGGSADG